MKRAFLVLALAGLSVVFVVAPAVRAETPYDQCKNRDPLKPKDTDDPFQRCFIIHNDLPFTIYPVIQSDLAHNCPDLPKYTVHYTDINGDQTGPASSLRIVVNDKTRGAGIAAGGTVTVALPKTQPCKTGGFYGAARIFILLAPVEKFEDKTVSAPNQRTDEHPDPELGSWTQDVCPGCWVGAAIADYGRDAPVQLVEYTFISQQGTGSV